MVLLSADGEGNSGAVLSSSCAQWQRPHEQCCCLRIVHAACFAHVAMQTCPQARWRLPPPWAAARCPHVHHIPPSLVCACSCFNN